jgi:hypothetical protein
MDYKWLLFCSQLPATPSSPRVMVWRRMRAAGATGMDNGVWILPYTNEMEKFTVELQTYVARQGGSSQIFFANTLNPVTEEEILERFRLDRDQEYSELKEQCQDFLADLEKETHNKNFSFAEYEENEQDLNKLEGWLVKIQRRDIVGENQAEEAAHLLEQCRQALQEFATQVFNFEDNDQEGEHGAIAIPGHPAGDPQAKA